MLRIDELATEALTELLGVLALGKAEKFMSVPS